MRACSRSEGPSPRRSLGDPHVGFAPQPVTEPAFPPSCAVLAAQLQIDAGEPSSETAFDTARIQAALTACPSGQGVELTASGANAAFLTQPLSIPAGVALIVDGGVTVFAS